MTAYESLVPIDLGSHLVPNRKRLNTYDAQKAEIEGIIDSRVGKKVKEVQIKPSRGDNPVDVSVFTKGKSMSKSETNNSTTHAEVVQMGASSKSLLAQHVRVARPSASSTMSKRISRRTGKDKKNQGKKGGKGKKRETRWIV